MSKLEIYTGPMKGGKTTALLNKYDELSTHTTKRLKIFKPIIDTRFSETMVTSRDGKQLLCTNINSIADIQLFKDEYDIFFIDEFQFLEGDINQLLKLFFDENKDFYISGLNLTAERKPFGLMDKLFPYATDIYLLKGNCDICGDENKGIYTYYDGNKQGDILVGEDNYKCVCYKCYETLNRRMK